MNDKTQQLLQEFATKLGTTVEHLWEVLVKQAWIEGMQDAVFVAIVLTIWGALTFYVRKFHRYFWKDYAEDKYSNKIGMIVTAWVVYAVMSCIAFGLVIGFSFSAQSCFQNPEFWALKQLPRP